MKQLTPSRISAPPRILVFDSGVGGLSIARAITDHLPGVAITYVSDNQAFPYGTKTEAEVVVRVAAVLSQLVPEIAPDILVVACNTASTVALPRIRGQLTLPVVGVVPAIKPAAALSQSRVIGLLATPGTVARAYTRQLIDEFAADCEIIAVGSSELVELVERYLHGESLDTAQLARIVAPLFEHPRSDAMDTVVLGCTHFPLIGEALAALRPGIHWVDSGAAIARRTASLLQGRGAEANAGIAHRALFTLRKPGIDRLATFLAAMGLNTIDYIDIAQVDPVTGDD